MSNDSVTFRLSEHLKDAGPVARIELDKNLYEQFVAEQMAGDTKENPANTKDFQGVPVVFSKSVPFGNIVFIPPAAPAPPAKEPAKAAPAKADKA